LRRKRAREQIMQVVEGYVREQTITATLQAYIEANFLNDMMNYSNGIMTAVIENELRRCIKGVLSDIYFAHISTLFLENLLINDIRALALECCLDHQQTNNAAHQTIAEV